MRTKIKKVLLILCVLLLVAVCLSALVACNNNRGKNANSAQQRRDAVATVKNAFLTNMGEGWESGMSDAGIAALSDAGDYIVAAGWADMFGDVLTYSTLQTAKLRAFASELNSENGKSLLEDFTTNAELLIPLLKNVGFTSSDISSLVYDMLCAIVNNTDAMFNAMLSNMNRVRALGSISNQTRNNISVNYANVNAAKAFVPKASERSEMLAAFGASRTAMDELVSFAYNLSVTSVTDNIFESISSGALTNITDGEITTYINSLINSVSSLKTAMSADEREKLNTSLNLVIEHFDSAVSSSAMFSQMVKYAKYAYLCVDIIPAMCDIMSAGAGSIDSAFITLIRECAAADTDTYSPVNNGIIYAKVMSSVMNEYTAAELKGIIADIAQYADNDYQKMLPLYYVDVALNVMFYTTDNFSSVHKDILSEEDLADFIVMAIFESWLDGFKQKYYDYRNGNATLSELQSFSQQISNSYLGSTNPYNIKDKTSEWYNWYVTTTTEVLQRKSISYMDTALRDINAFIDDIYAMREDIDSQAALTFIASETDANYERALQLFMKTGAMRLDAIGGLIGF